MPFHEVVNIATPKSDREFLVVFSVKRWANAPAFPGDPDQAETEVEGLEIYDLVKIGDIPEGEPLPEEARVRYEDLDDHEAAAFDSEFEELLTNLQNLVEEEEGWYDEAERERFYYGDE